jgi:hypothetical protein
MKNAPSIALFESLGFVETSQSDIFQEITYSLEVNDEVRERFLTKMKFEFNDTA